MKKIRFTILGLAFTALFAIGVNAQERGSRGERNSKESHVTKNKRPDAARGNSRINNHKDNNSWNNDSRIKRVEPTKRATTPRNSRDNSNWNKDRRIKRVEPTRSTTRISSNSSNSLSNRDFRNNPVRINSSRISRSTRPITNVNVKHYKKYKHNNVNFYANKGIYYRSNNNGYVRYMPSNGFRVNILPIGYSTINLGNRNSYYFYEGVYYKPYKNYYEVIQAPIGAIVYGLPSGYERVRFSGEYIYEFGGTLYQRINHRGDRAYQVIGYLS